MVQRRHTPAGRVLTELILEVFRLNGRLLAAGDRLTRPAGQTSARWQVVGALDKEPRSVSQIARGMGLARQSAQHTTDRLEREGLVRYRQNPAHLRAKLVELTPRGRAVLDGITQRQVVWANELGARLGQAALQRAERIIRAFRNLLEGSDPAPPRGRARGRRSAKVGASSSSTEGSAR
jgi:DNA-binding MarR family transcriptional regulator